MAEEGFGTFRDAFSKEEEFLRWNGGNGAIGYTLFFIDIHTEFVALLFVLAEPRCGFSKEIVGAGSDAWTLTVVSEVVLWTFA
ncbi:MAG: hypothetical protein QF535_03520 [Anaerolineales bacterium]|nr:hypothetical protein [Anaerolineales bacterium]